MGKNAAPVSAPVRPYWSSGSDGSLLRRAASGNLRRMTLRVPEWPARPSRARGVSLALGGGFARGFAHLGVLKVFEQQRIPIAAIAGSSIGSIIGAAYASGVPLARIISVSRSIRFRDFARWRVSRLGLASNQRLGDLILRVLQARTFEDLFIPLAVVATDLGSGEAVEFTRGGLSDAIRASCAFPGLFEPVEIGTRCLVDGGLAAPVPTRAARVLGGGCVVGVSVGVHDGRSGNPSNIFQVVSRAVSAAQKNQAELWEREADLVLRPDVQSIAWDDFASADEAIEAGAAAANLAIPRIQELLARPIASPELHGASEDDAPGTLWLAEVMR